MCSCSKLLILFIFLGLLGAAFVIVGAVLGFVVFDNLIEDTVNELIPERVRLQQGTEQFERWAELPFPLLFKVYIFNVTNPDEVLELGDKPKVDEIGPFVYRQYRYKKDIEYFEETDILRYIQGLYYEFDREASAYDEDTEVTVLNTPLQGILQIAPSIDFTQTVNSVWRTAFHGAGFFHTIAAKQYIFEGFEFCNASLLTAVTAAVARIFCSRVRTLTENSKTIVTGQNPTVSRFSFFNHKQNSSDGPYEIHAGMQDIHTLGAILSWNEQQYLDAWVGGEGSTCNRIRGRDSSIYPPFNNDSSSFDIFNTDICRVVNLETAGMATYKDVTGLLLRLRENTFDNDGDNACYCTKRTWNFEGELECLPQGFADMYSCFDAPTVVSFPHMLWANESYSSSVEGLSPDVEKHSTFVIIEPDTGTPLQGAKRIQFNMIIRPIEGIVVTENIKSAVVPILWVEEALDLPQDLVDQLKDDYLNRISRVNRIATAVTWLLIAVGIALLLSTIVYFIYKLVT